MTSRRHIWRWPSLWSVTVFLSFFWCNGLDFQPSTSTWQCRKSLAARQTPQDGAFFGSNGVGSEYTSWAITITNAHGDLQGIACRRGDGSVKNRSLRIGLYSLESGRNETRWLYRNYVCILLPDVLCWHKLRPLHRKKCFITRGATVPSPISQRMRVPPRTTVSRITGDSQILTLPGTAFRLFVAQHLSRV
jgi:hypothetical protein